MSNTKSMSKFMHPYFQEGIKYERDRIEELLKDTGYPTLAELKALANELTQEKNNE